MRNNPQLHFFLRIDGSARAVPGTGVWRKKKPATGNWIEIVEANYCCAPYSEITATPDTDTGTASVVFTLLCDDVEVAVGTIFGAYADATEATAALNASLGFYGVFTTDGTDITLKLKQDIAEGLCADGTLTMTIDIIAEA